MDNQIRIDLDNIDVEQIIAQIHADLEQRGYRREDLLKLDQQFMISSADKTTAEWIRETMAKTRIEYMWPIQRIPGRLGGLKTGVIKVIRRFTRFYMKHVMDQQNDFNYHIVYTISALYENQDNVNAQYQQQIKSLKDCIDELKQENALCRRNIEQLSVRLDQSKDAQKTEPDNH